MKKDYILPNLDNARFRDKEVSKKVIFNIEDKYKDLGVGKKYFVITHGCQANVRDSETICGILDSLKYTVCDNENNADLIVINTCAVRQGAEDKVLGQLGALKRLKTANPNLVIAVGGCMSQEETTVNTILEKYRQVDIIFGTHNISSLPKLLFDVYETKQRKIEVFSKMGDIVENIPVTRFMSHKAWVNIMYGCNNFCTYCIVPYTRGKERSRDSKDIIFECKQLVEQGYKEICLLGQNVNSYGKDLGSIYGFGDLLNDVAATGIKRLRFMTSNPWNFDDKIISAFKNNTNIMPYIHLPLQSGSDEILRKMNRKHTSKEYMDLFDKLKNEIPNCAFTTDIIVGFPNESDEMFNDTLKVVDHCKYDNAYTFIYSKRDGTPAASMDDCIDRKTKENRLQQLNEKVAYYANLNNQKYKDAIVEVLVDGISKKNDKVYSGYTPENKLINFTGENIQVGQLVKVRITEVLSFSLNGVAIEK